MIKQPWWRPLIGRKREYDDTGLVRLIGLELRLRDPFGMQEEIQMIPLAIELPHTSNAACIWEFGPCTLHTSVGDINIPPVRILASGL
jgi:hypothetical protein